MPEHRTAPATGMTPPAPKVSVLMITYNHAPFIAQAIESALMQVTDFAVEIVIGEDCSTDNTLQIIKGYQEKYPDKIKLLTGDRNIGMFDNFLRTLHACTGQYLASLDGDDYWTNKDKLQIQCDFLGAHPDHTAVYHDILIQHDLLPIESGRYIGNRRPALGVEDLLRENAMQACSVMCRNGVWGELPDWTRSLGCIDWVINLLNAKSWRDWRYQRRDGCFAGRHRGGVWTSLPPYRQLESLLPLYRYINVYFNDRDGRLIRLILCKHYYDLALAPAWAGNVPAAKRYALQCLNPRLHPRHLLNRDLARPPVGMYAPTIFALQHAVQIRIKGPVERW